MQRVGDSTIVNTEGVPINPSTEDTQGQIQAILTLMGRLVKFSESLQVTDSAQRQRVTIDAVAGNLTLGSLTTVNAVNTVTAQTSMAGMDREMYINIAKQTYAQSIRANLTFQ